jgi:multidrug efflux pump subunit AcrA (membrane-fusion protein)
MKIKNIILVLMLASALGLWNFESHSSESSSMKQVHHETWYCPMHPNYTSDRPGHCPICGMDLVKKIEVPAQTASDVSGYTTIDVTSSKQQLIGVRTAIVAKQNAVKTIHAVGQYEGEVLAQVFEDDLEFIKVGQKVIAEIPAYHQRYEGAVLSIDSTIDEASRTARVHIWLKHINPRLLKTNMFVNVEFPVSIGETIIIPRDALMDTGLRKIVFIQKSEGTFQPREIQTGMETDDGIEVRSGLNAGERIVISGNFLLDSESRVQASLQAETASTAGGEAHG